MARGDRPEEPTSITARIAPAIAWFAATFALALPWLVSGDGPPAMEVGTIPALIWIGLAAVLVGRRLFDRNARGARTGSSAPDGFLRPIPLDLPVGLWIGWSVLAASVVMLTGTGWIRAAQHLTVQSIGAAALYGVARYAALDRRAALLALALLFGGIAFLTAHGLHQGLVVNPAVRRAYFESTEAEKQRQLQQVGLTRTEAGARERRLFEDRLRSTEPTATFSLTNSLGVVLAAGWGLGLHLLFPLGRSSGSVPSERRRLDLPQLSAIALLVGAMVAIALLLILTKSRAAWGAAGLISLGWLVPACRSPLIRRIAIVSAVLLAITVVAAFATGRLDRQVITEAPKSLAYRAEYWRATLPMIADHPLFGVGPGSFQDRYRRYQLPESSETVADPHDAWIEAAAVSGLPAGVALGALTLIAVVWRIGRRRSERSLESSDSDEREPRSVRPDGTIVAAMLLALFLAVVAAVPLGIYQGLLVDFDAWGGAVIVPLIAAIVVAWGSIRAFDSSDERTGARVDAFVRGGSGAGLVAIAVALLVSGGYGFWGVGSIAWGLLGLWGTRRSAESTSGDSETASGRRTAVSERSGSRSFGMALLVAAAVAWFWGLFFVALPQLRGWNARIATRLAVRSGNERRGAAALSDWVRDQPVSEEPWQLRGEGALMRLVAGERPDEARREYAAAGLEYERRRPGNASRRFAYALGYLSAWRAGNAAEDLQEAERSMALAVAGAPNDALYRAQWAYLLDLLGRRDESAEQAERALELDRLDPHADRDLRLQSIWTGNGPAAESAEQLVERLRSNAEGPL